MIQNVSAFAGTDFFDIFWSPPSIPPMTYRINVACRLLCNNMEYNRAKVNRRPYLTTQNVDNLLPGSACTFTLLAVYNPASIDSGITRTVFTLNTSKYVCREYGMDTSV